jgi:hypothetical protein
MYITTVTLSRNVFEDILLCIILYINYIFSSFVLTCFKNALLNLPFSQQKVKMCKPLTDKKENKIFLIYKEICSGTGAKSYMRKIFFYFLSVR